MPTILPLSPRNKVIVSSHGLTKKFKKQCALLADNPRHPGLCVELLEPKSHGVYSFRIDKKYRALFVFRPDTNKIEILAVTVHYR